MTILRKIIQEPWLRWIVEGRKTYEGRVNRGIWVQVDVGQEIIFYNDQREVKVVIENLSLYDNFGDAWSAHKKELIPEGATTKEDAQELYSQYYTEDDIAKHGVVILGLHLLQ